MDPWVIVGAGAAGAVIASRATESSDVEVLLVEAGPDYPQGLPRDLVDGKRNSMHRHDWGYRHVPSTTQPLVFPFPRGRVVGGSSAVNTCIAVRGRPYDYDEWGLPDWTWQRCLPAFKRLENDLDVRDEFHGKDGPIRIRRHTREELTPWQAAFMDACKAHGLRACDDANHPEKWGYAPQPMNKIGGERQSAAVGYLTREVRKRRNLRIQARTLVRRVIFSDRRVTGVEVEREGRVEVIRASRVILSGGAINTPGILMRSGVGHAEKVRKLGVSVVSHVPAVAQKLLDHPGAAIFFLPKLSLVAFDLPIIQTAYRYTGPGREHVPMDMQIQAGSMGYFPSVTVPVVSLMCQVGKPRGYGTLEYESADPHEKPRIHTRAFEDMDDRRAGVAAMRLAYEIAREAPMRELGVPLWPRPKTLMSDDALLWILRACDSGYHPCGTVPMGKDGDVNAATDSRGRVRGVRGLYVADMSLTPTVPTANTHLTALMIGERFGAWLRRGEL